MAARLVFIFLLCVAQAHGALQWSASSPADGASVPVCEGQEAVLDWNYTLGQGEQVEDIRWYVADDRSNQMIAIYADGNFVAMPTFSGRVRHLGNARLAVDHVTPGDAGNYSVDVTIPHVSGTYTRAHRMVRLQVVAPPKTRGGDLSVEQSRDAVYSNDTGSLHVKLTCGVFIGLGQPPVDVLWQTPSGSSLPSSNYVDGCFELLLDNPVEGGNYSCRLNPSSPATVCFHDDDTMMQKVTVTVDEVKARLTLMEAQQVRMQTELKAENADLRQQVDQNQRENADLRQQVDQYHRENANLTQLVAQNQRENADLKQQMDQYQQLVDQYHRENVNLTQLVVQNQRENSNLTEQLHSVQAELSHFRDAASRRVSFSARLSTHQQVSNGNPVIPTHVYTNEGSAYSNTTGRFTAPLNGTFVFLVSVGASGQSPPAAGVWLMKENDEVCTAYSYFSGSDQGSSCQAVLQMAKGQTAWLRAHGYCYYWNVHTVFSGFLLQADD